MNLENQTCHLEHQVQFFREASVEFDNEAEALLTVGLNNLSMMGLYVLASRAIPIDDQSSVESVGGKKVDRENSACVLVSKTTS